MRLDRFSGGPILSPSPDHAWEAACAFLNCSVDMNLAPQVGRAVLCAPTAARGLAALPNRGSWRDLAVFNPAAWYDKLGRDEMDVA